MFEYLLQTQFNKNIIGYDNICKITKNIYHGNNKSLEYLNHFNIKEVIVIECNDRDNHNKTTQIKSNLNDDKNKNINVLKLVINKEDKLIKFYDKVWNFFEENYNKNILIQCKDGSISLMLLISYLIAYKFYTYEEAFDYILAKKENNINIKLLNQTYIDEMIELDKNLRHFKNKVTLK